MNKVDKKIRRIKYLVCKMHLLQWGWNVRDKVDEMLTSECLPSYMRRNEIIELKNLLASTIISQEEIVRICGESLRARGIPSDKHKQSPIIHRDNKGVYIGGGGSGNKIRYPSQKRSLRVWKIFYSMFPYYAEKDHWDGKTSDKIKNK